MSQFVHGAVLLLDRTQPLGFGVARAARIASPGAPKRPIRGWRRFIFSNAVHVAVPLFAVTMRIFHETKLNKKRHLS